MEGAAWIKALRSKGAKACSANDGPSGLLASELETLLVEGTLPPALKTEKPRGPVTHTRSRSGMHRGPGVLLTCLSLSSGPYPNLSETEGLTAAPHVASTPHHHTFGVGDLRGEE